uniref:Alphavirus-like MT domain-containing protein n=1 Tax=Beihai hepe-like virus 7 TaxID=1922384 RepID=A0A1L3KJJ5_9VIRU|nr:hypothetical protein [Beihai hepe-like virus 7]
MSIIEENSYPGQARESLSILQNVNWEEYYQETQLPANTIQVGFMVKPETKALIHKLYSPFNFKFNAGGIASQHPIPSVGLIIGNEMLERYITPETLHIGGSFNNPNVHSVHSISARDIARAAKASRFHRHRPYTMALSKQNTTGVQNMEGRYETAVMNNVYDIEFDQLPDIMENLGLKTIHAVMILPKCLAYGHDSYNTEDGFGIKFTGELATMYFKDDMSWAYTHSWKNWAKWTTRNVSEGKYCNVLVERIQNFGPMHLLQITRTFHGDRITMPLPDPYMDMIQVVDFCGAADQFHKLLSSYYTIFTKAHSPKLAFEIFLSKILEIKKNAKKVYIPRKIYDKLVTFVYNRDDNMMNRNAASVYLQGQIQTITVSNTTLQHGYELRPEEFAIVSKNAFVEAAAHRYKATKQIAYYMNIFSEEGKKFDQGFLTKAFNTLDIIFSDPFKRKEGTPLRNAFNKIIGLPSDIAVVMYSLICQQVEVLIQEEVCSTKGEPAFDTKLDTIYEYDPPSDGYCAQRCLDKICLNKIKLPVSPTAKEITDELTKNEATQAFGRMNIDNGHATIKLKGGMICEHARAKMPIVGKVTPILLSFDENKYDLPDIQKTANAVAKMEGSIFTDDELLLHAIVRATKGVVRDESFIDFIAKALGKPFYKDVRCQLEKKIKYQTDPTMSPSAISDLCEMKNKDVEVNCFCRRCQPLVDTSMCYLTFSTATPHERIAYHLEVISRVSRATLVIIPDFTLLLRYPTTDLLKFITKVSKFHFFHITHSGALCYRKTLPPSKRAPRPKPMFFGGNGSYAMCITPQENITYWKKQKKAKQVAAQAAQTPPRLLVEDIFDDLGEDLQRFFTARQDSAQPATPTAPPPAPTPVGTPTITPATSMVSLALDPEDYMHDIWITKCDVCYEEGDKLDCGCERCQECFAISGCEHDCCQVCDYIKSTKKCKCGKRICDNHFKDLCNDCILCTCGAVGNKMRRCNHIRCDNCPINCWCGACACGEESVATAACGHNLCENCDTTHCELTEHPTCLNCTSVAQIWLDTCGHHFCRRCVSYESCRSCRARSYVMLPRIDELPPFEGHTPIGVLKAPECFDGEDELLKLLQIATVDDEYYQLVKDCYCGRPYASKLQVLTDSVTVDRQDIRDKAYHGTVDGIYQGRYFGKQGKLPGLQLQTVTLQPDPSNFRVKSFLRTLETKDEKYAETHRAAIKNAERLMREDSEECEIKLALGVAGCGKTSDVVEKYGKDKETVVVVPYAKLKGEYANKGMTAYTIAKFLQVNPKKRRVIMDEAFAMHPGFINLAQKMCSEMVLVGDDKQLDYNDGQTSVSRIKPLREVLTYDPTIRKTVSYGMPVDIVHWVQPIYGIDITTINTTVKSVQFHHKVRVPDGCMVFAEYDEKAHKGVTVAKSQGMRMPEVNLFFSPRSKMLLNIHGQKLVAVSRHTRKLNIYLTTDLLGSVMGYPDLNVAKEDVRYIQDTSSISENANRRFDFRGETYNSIMSAYQDCQVLSDYVGNTQRLLTDIIKVAFTATEMESLKKKTVIRVTLDGNFGTGTTMAGIQNTNSYDGENKYGKAVEKAVSEFFGQKVGARTDFRTQYGFYGNDSVTFEVGEKFRNSEGIVTAPQNFYTNLSLYSMEPPQTKALLLDTPNQDIEDNERRVRSPVFPFLETQDTTVNAVEEVLQKVATTSADSYTADRDIFHQDLGNIGNKEKLVIKNKRGDAFSEGVRTGFVMGGRLRGRPCQTKNLTQELHCAVQRYMKKGNSDTYAKAKAKADKLYDGFNKLFRMEKARPIDPEELALAVGEQVGRIQLKKQDQDEGIFGDNYWNTEQIKFHLKGQTKADLNADSYLRGSMDDNGKYILKAGQGISAAPKTINHIAACYIRAIESRLNEIKKPFVHFGYGHTKEQFKNIFMNNGDFHHEVASVDIKEQDTTKGLWTQLYTDMIYAKFGVPIVIRKALKNIGHNWILRGRDFKVKVGDFFQSGRPDTLLDNTLMTFGCLGDAFHLKRPRVVAAQGDDGYLSAKKITKKDVTLVEYKINRNKVGDFVGFLIGDNEVYLDIPRLAVKLMNRVYGNAAELEEYKTAVSDWLEFIDNPGHAYRTSLHVAHKYDINVQDANTLLAFLYNFARGKLVPSDFRTASVVRTTITQKKL